MRFCNKCKHITAGKNPFCQQCGSTFDVKLCPRLHVNPRAAQVCSQCGSKELSSPHPPFPLLLKPVIVLLGVGPGVLLLVVLLIYAVYFAYRLIQDPNGLLPLMCIGFALGLLFFLWMTLHHAAGSERSKHK